jgi:hypothetical protein
MTRFLVLAATVATASTAMGQIFFESGAAGTFSTSNWTVDRYAPNGWAAGSTDPIGGDALKISISNADRAQNRPGGQQGDFYNTQGRSRAVSLSTTWQIGGELYIPGEWGQSGNLRRSDLWGRDNGSDPLGTVSYVIAGFVNNDASDPFNPTASNFSGRFRVWDPNAGWENLTATVNYDAYNSFAIESTGTEFNYYINGNLVKTYTGASYSLLGLEDLSRVFVQAYNFGVASNANTLLDSSYDAYWRNTYAAVPAPGAAAVAGIAGLMAARRRR